MSIAENITRIRQLIDEAAGESGLTGADITLVGASKMNDSASCQAAIAAGIDALGENRVQEMTEKLGQNAYDGAPLHFIGHLQRNKVKQVVGKVSLIQSVSSEELLREIDKQADKLGLVQDILLEVNIGDEEAKSGFTSDTVYHGAQLCLELEHVNLRGLMAIPPVAVNEADTIPYFEEMRRLFVDINEKMYHNNLTYLSMGMSGDYQSAIRHGSNMVRVGSAIFGARNYNT